MGKTSSERSRIYRKKLKEDVEMYDIYKSKDKDRKRAERSKPKNLSPSEIEKKKRLNRERVKKFKLRKKAAKITTDCRKETAYRTPQALGKAVNKVKSRLPKSPRKRKAVVIQLASATGIHLQKKQKIISDGNKGLCLETLEKIKSFYILDSVSRHSPGKKDFVITRVQGKKEYIQKRHLLYSLRETHALFLQENPAMKVGLSTFCSLRPVNVLLSSDIPRNVCLCQYHENIKLICDCLSKVIPEFPFYSGDFVQNAVCDSKSEECMMGRCGNCPKWIENVIKGCDCEVIESQVTWNQWERIDVAIPKGKKRKAKVVKKMKKICKEGTVRGVLTSLQGKLPSFLEHVFIKRHQSSYFEERLSNLKKDEAVVQVDFAENYTCQYQDEIQSAHWNQEQVTLFTAAVWTRSPNGDKVCESHVIVSDELVHDKKAVAVCMSIVIDRFVKEKHGDVEKVYVFSDGPSSQFKNRYIVNFLHELNNKVSIQWNYFATSHGKGAVDGIGGTMKRMVWNAVRSRKAPAVVNAKTFYEVAKKLTTSITASFVSEKEMNEMSDLLCLQTCFNEAPPLPGISRFHCIEPEDGYVKCRIHSNQSSCENRMAPEVFPYDSDETDESVDELFDEKQESDDKSESKEEASDWEATSDLDEADCDDKQENEMPDHAGFICNTQGVPDELCNSFKQSVSLQLPHHMTTQVDAIVSGLIRFCGSSLIDESDIQGLIGNHKTPEQNWLSNFVIDDYLKLIKLACANKGIEVQTIRWEIFEKGSISAIVKENDSSRLLNQDLILIPCNPLQSSHWFLLAVLPKKELVLALDSLAGDNLKPTVKTRLEKLAEVLTAVDPTLQIDRWDFIYNSKGDLPQQDNNYDCGVYTCMYSRCLAELGSMVDKACLLEVRKHMLLSLHRGILMEVPEDGIAVEEYYAVHYVKKYYIGRVLSTSNSNLVKVKFLHNAGADKFNWPKRDDIDEVYIASIFYGPVTLDQCGPFTIPKQYEIEKIYNTIH